MKSNFKRTQSRLRRLSQVSGEIRKNSLGVLYTFAWGHLYGGTLRELLVKAEELELNRRLLPYRLGERSARECLSYIAGIRYTFEGNIEELNIPLSFAIDCGFEIGKEGKLSLPCFLYPKSEVTENQLN